METQVETDQEVMLKIKEYILSRFRTEVNTYHCEGNIWIVDFENDGSKKTILYFRGEFFQPARWTERGIN